MKNRIVLWGTDENEKKVLIALELQVKENKVDVHTFPEELATEVFYNQMMNQWRNNEEIAFPEGSKKEERVLTVSGNLLPESIKVERTDIINRASSEWHFSVLSSKMYEMYKGEVDALKDKVEQLTEYDKDLWNEMKAFWEKVQGQVKEKNLYREHANTLRKSSDLVFDMLKKLRKVLDAEFEKLSSEAVNGFFGKMDQIEGKIDKGLGLKPIFEELKKVQSEFRDAKFTRDDRNKVWKRLDAAFKTVKEKRFGDAGEAQSATSRLQRRYDGLMSAVDKMQRSINRDKSDKNFQDKRIGQTGGQLEAQLRQAKVKMIDERISSKQLKLDDMMKTKIELEKKLAQEKKREVKREEKAKVEEVKNELKAKVVEEMKGKQAELSDDKKAKLEKAAAEIKETKKPKANAKEEAKEAPAAKATEEKDSAVEVSAIKDNGVKEPGLVEAITVLATEAIEDVVDTVKAVKEVVEEKIENVVDAISEEE